MVRCAAIGTSNSIMEGCFLWHLMKQPDVSLISAGLLGASPSAIGPFFALSDEFFQNCDYCLIDLCVIDLTVVDLKSADLVHILQWAEWIASATHIPASGCAWGIPLGPLCPFLVTESPRKGGSVEVCERKL